MKIFTNDKKMLELAKCRDFEGLKNEFLSSSLTARTGEWALSAANMYDYICRILRENGVLDKYIGAISKHANALFAEDWDIRALTMIKDHPKRYGCLSDEAKKVLAEYDSICNKAYNTFYNRISGRVVKEFEENIDGVIVKFSGGRFSFFKNGREHVLFYGDE